MKKLLIITLVIIIGVGMKPLPPKPVRTPPTPPKQKATVAPQPKAKQKPLFTLYSTGKPAPKGAKIKKEKARPMSDALHKLYERLDDWQYAGPLPYDTRYNGTPDPYPMPEFDKRVKAND